MKSTCRIGGCTNAAVARQLCAHHYHQWRTGRPGISAGPMTRRPIGLTWAEAFELVPKIVTASGCSEWQGHKSQYGYGIIQSKVYGSTGAHRVAYAIAHGPIPHDVHVCHRCDNPPCVNPDHLFLGRDKENVADMIQKLRHSYGEDSYHHRLTETEAIEILQRYAAGGIGRPQLGREYGVSASCIQGLTERRTWKHLDRTALAALDGLLPGPAAQATQPVHQYRIGR